ncbi:MAG: hypothetical protein R3Y56_10115 [Akkermansia sp.]
MSINAAYANDIPTSEQTALNTPSETVEQNESSEQDIPSKKSKLETIIGASIYICVVCWMISTFRSSRKKDKILKELHTPEGILQYYENKQIETDPNITADNELVINLNRELGEWKTCNLPDDFPAKMKYVPQDVEHFSRTVTAYNQLLAAHPSDDFALNTLAESAKAISEANTRSFTGSKAIYFFFILFAVIIITKQVKGIMKAEDFLDVCKNVWIIFIFIAPSCLYFFASQRPKFLIFQTIIENKNSNVSVASRFTNVLLNALSTMPYIASVNFLL